MNRVVVTGLGVIAPAGQEKEEFWGNSVNGVNSIAAWEYPEYNLQSRLAGRVNEIRLNKENGKQKEFENMGRPAVFAMVASENALLDSGCSFLTSKEKEKAGICISTAIADSPFCETQFEKIIKFYEKEGSTYEQLDSSIDDAFFKKGSFSDVTTAIAKKYDIHGPVFTMSTGCVGGLDAIGTAFDFISEGDVDVMICGASEAPLTPLTFASFDIIRAISRRNSKPERASSPFDRDRDGFVLSEGAGIVVLEEYEHALKRKAPIYAEILSYETCNNAHHMTALPGNGEPLAEIIERAVSSAGIRKDEIDFISAHGSSTPQNDIFETEAYKKAFGDYAYNIPISAHKAIMGHPLGAASGVEFVRACMALRENIIPPTAHLENPDPECDLDYVPNNYRRKELNYILIDASGFSGIHSCIVLKNGRQAKV